MALFNVSNNGRTGELVIYDLIGDTFLGSGVSARLVNYLLSEVPDMEELTVRINSIGGSVQDGTAIYNLLQRHKAKVIVEIEGAALSAASVVAMAGDEIRMLANAMMMMHGAWGMTEGNAVAHERAAKALAKMTEASAEVYAARTETPKEEVVQMLEEETWFTAEEALKKGFCTSILPAKSPPAAQQAYRDADKVMKLYKHPPQQLYQMLGSYVGTRRPGAPQPAPVMAGGKRQGLARLAAERRRTLGDV